jgi:hypothetical protein
MKRSLPNTFVIAIMMLSMGQPLRARKPQVGRAQVQRVACCVVTAIGSPAGVVTAKDNATGRTFEFQAPSTKVMPQIHVGMPVYANFSTMQVSLNGTADCCKIISISPPPAAVAPAPATKPAPAPPPASTPVGRPALGAPPAAAPVIAPKIAPAPAATAPAPQRVLTPYVATPAAKPTPGAPSAGATVTAPKIAPAPIAAGEIRNKVAPAAPSCTISAIDINTGVVTATETATSKIFQFKLNDATQLNSLQVGRGVYANFAAGQVSFDGITPNGTILSTASAPAVISGMGVGATVASPGTLRDEKKKPATTKQQPSSTSNIDRRNNIGNEDSSKINASEGDTEGAIRGVTAAPGGTGQPSGAEKTAIVHPPVERFPCCEVTAIDSHTSIGTAKDNANGRTFEFQVTKPALLPRIQPGTRIYVNFKLKVGEVSLDDITPCGIILVPKSTPTNPGMGATAPTVLPGTLRDGKIKEATQTPQPSSSSSSTASSGVSSSSNAATASGADPGIFIDRTKLTVPPQVSILDCSPSNFISGTSMSCKVSLDRPAPPGLDVNGARRPGAPAPPTNIQISTSNSAVASVPGGTISIIPGATTADFQVPTTAYPEPVDVKISASYEGSNPKSTNVTLTPALIRTFGCENVLTDNIPFGDTGSSSCENVGGSLHHWTVITMNFSGPTPSGLVTVSSSSGAAVICAHGAPYCYSSLAVPVQTGARWENWQAGIFAVSAPTTVTLSALDPLSKLVKTVQLKIDPPAPTDVLFLPQGSNTTVTTISNVPAGGQQVATYVRLNDSPPDNGITFDVKYSASDAAGNPLQGAVTGSPQFTIGPPPQDGYGFPITVQPCEVNAPCKVSVTVGPTTGTFYVNP